MYPSPARVRIGKNHNKIAIKIEINQIQGRMEAAREVMVRLPKVTITQVEQDTESLISIARHHDIRCSIQIDIPGMDRVGLAACQILHLCPKVAVPYLNPELRQVCGITRIHESRIIPY